MRDYCLRNARRHSYIDAGSVGAKKFHERRIQTRLAILAVSALLLSFNSGMAEENRTYSWYALRVRSRHENTVALHLQARCYESFLPVYKSERRWSDRFKEIELPLFPGYVFCQFNPLNRLPILSVPGIV